MIFSHLLSDLFGEVARGGGLGVFLHYGVHIIHVVVAEYIHLAAILVMAATVAVVAVVALNILSQRHSQCELRRTLFAFEQKCVGHVPVVD